MLDLSDGDALASYVSSFEGAADADPLAPFRAIGDWATKNGYDAIKYKSFRSSEGINYALLEKFDFENWLHQVE